LLRPPGIVRAEREPNNEPRTANRIAGTVTGFLGQRTSATEGDRDYYRYEGSGRRVITVTVTGLPNLDISLTVEDLGGHAAATDEGRIGEGEAMHRRVIDGPVLVGIGQTLPAGQKLPTENVSDPYTVTITEERADAGELEPNNMDADATPLLPTYELRGFLDTQSDVDLLRWTGETGTYIVVVRADGIPLQWKLADGKARTPGEATVELQKGELVRIERNPAQPQTKRDGGWSIVVVGNGRAK
jgi:hypothetical protein